MKLTFLNKRERNVMPLFIRLLTACNKQLKNSADHLQRSTAHFSLRTWKILLVMFCVAFSCESGWILWQSIKSKSSEVVHVTPISFVPLMQEPDKVIHQVTDSIYHHIHLFQRYMDSLGGTPSGKRIRDSFLNVHPHLIDTINYLEQFYQQSSKK